MTELNHSGNSNIAICGVGLVTNLGLDAGTTWQNICELRRGIGPMPALEQVPSPDKGGGQAPDLPDDFAPDLPREARYLRFAVMAALKDAGISDQMPVSPDRCGLLMGTRLHGIRAAGRFFRSGQYSDFDSFLAPATLHLATGDLGLGGVALTTCSACSSGLGSVALAMTLLESGELDLVIAGGYDPVSEYAYAGFNALRLVAEGSAKPFCRDREGLKLAEGYGVLVLQRAEDVHARGARVDSIVLGYGESCDAHHLTQPHPDGDGAARAMTTAIEHAGVAVDQIDLISAHATSTPNNDGGEYLAMNRVFGAQLPHVPVVSFKSHLGHTLGGAGAVELILAGEARRHQIIPPTAHVQADELEFPNLNLAMDGPQSKSVGLTLNSAFGFGGANTCLVSGPFDPSSVKGSGVVRSPENRSVYISGVGVMLPNASGNEAFAEHLSTKPDITTLADQGPIDDRVYAEHLNARRLRRMSDYVKMILTATTFAMQDAGIEDTEAFSDQAHAILGSAHGAAGYSWDYYRQVVEEGIAAANPMLFAEGVPNSGSAHLSLMLGLKGSAQTIIGSRTSGLEAMRLAAVRIRTGHWDRAIIAAGDEYCTLTNSAFAECGFYRSSGGHRGPFDGRDGFAAGCGAVCLVLESEKSLTARSAQPRGRIDVCAGAVGRQGDVRHIVSEVSRVVEAMGCPKHVVGSANSTCIDRFESAGLESAGSAVISSLYGHVPEIFSVMPLASIAAVLLRGKMPACAGSSPDLTDPLQPALGDEALDRVGILSVDYAGLVAGATLQIESVRLS